MDPTIMIGILFFSMFVIFMFYQCFHLYKEACGSIIKTNCYINSNTNQQKWYDPIEALEDEKYEEKHSIEDEKYENYEEDIENQMNVDAIKMIIN